MKKIFLIVLIPILLSLIFIFILKRWPIPTFSNGPKYIPKGFHIIAAFVQNDSKNQNISFIFYENDKQQILTFSKIENSPIDCSKLKDTSFSTMLNPIQVPNSEQSCYFKTNGNSGEKYFLVWSKNNNKYIIETDNFSLDDYTLQKISENTNNKIIFFNDTRFFSKNN